MIIDPCTQNWTAWQAANPRGRQRAPTDSLAEQARPRFATREWRSADRRPAQDRCRLRMVSSIGTGELCCHRRDRVALRPRPAAETRHQFVDVRRVRGSLYYGTEWHGAAARIGQARLPWSRWIPQRSLSPSPVASRSLWARSQICSVNSVGPKGDRVGHDAERHMYRPTQDCGIGEDDFDVVRGDVPCC
jgi:hypothetical protein